MIFQIHFIQPWPADPRANGHRSSKHPPLLSGRIGNQIVEHPAGGIGSRSATGASAVSGDKASLAVSDSLHRHSVRMGLRSRLCVCVCVFTMELTSIDKLLHTDSITDQTCRMKCNAGNIRNALLVWVYSLHSCLRGGGAYLCGFTPWKQLSCPSSTMKN